MAPGLMVVDDDGAELRLDAREADQLLAIADQFEAATVSACPGCRSRVLAAVAFVDLLDAAPPHPRTRELIELADDAPTLHLYVVDEADACRHERWRDPLFDEWLEAVEEAGPRARP